ncbi:GT-D fold domain-containing glycosyltransferase [Marinobacterium lutimaris]|uniref:Glycosyltransferase, SP_1767 family n=1 Tax=Marinobacterium lutimaris TaxID=568106 RepID=A0A1H6DB91_9GAMM|nr:GT-D fold domain-containing glycosyltransferase [Marinobacterium lutimaris]SEG82581.1 glycosyltransferase, SP_1767 family [Marinobacterium lutimaris]
MTESANNHATPGPLKPFLRGVLRKSALILAPFGITRNGRARVREFFDDRIISLYRDDIESFIRRYPKVWSEEETIQYIIDHKASICRYGDGELKLIVGERHKSFQDVNPALNNRLLEVLHSDDPNILIGVHPVRNFHALGRIWQKFIIRIGDEVLGLLDLQREYPSMGAFRVLPRDSKESLIKRVRLIKEIWEGRNVVLVTGKNSRFTFEEELFNNAASVEFFYAPSKNAFDRYEEILSDIQKKYPKENYLILPVLGPTATILAYDLAKAGYQAIDFGQMPGTFKKAKQHLYGNEEAKIEELLR